MATKQEIIDVLSNSSLWKRDPFGNFRYGCETGEYRIHFDDKKNYLLIEKYVIIPASEIRDKSYKKWMILSAGSYGAVFLEPGKIKIGRDRQFDI